MTDARKDMSGVMLNLHAAAAAVALLPAPELAVEKSLVQFEPGRQAREERDQSFAVRFSGSKVAQHKCSILPDAASRRIFRDGESSLRSRTSRKKGPFSEDFSRAQERE